MFDPDLYAARTGQFVGVNFGLQAVFGGGFQHTVGFFNGKKSLVAEHIHKVGQFFLAHRRNHFFNNQVHILALTTNIFARHGVRRQEVGLYLRQAQGFKTRNDTQHFKFAFQVQTIAALNFHGPRAVGHHLLKT